MVRGRTCSLADAASAAGVKLDKELSTIELDGTRVRCGGGARLPTGAPSALVAAQAGLTGIEFGVNIPGTVGGSVPHERQRVRGRARSGAGVGRRGSQLPRGPDGVTPTSSGSPTAARVCAPSGGRRAGPRWARRRRDRAGQGDSRGHASTPEGRPAVVGIKTLALRSRTPAMTRAPRDRTAGQLLDAAGCRALRSGAQASPPSTRTSSRITATPPRRRVAVMARAAGA